MRCSRTPGRPALRRTRTSSQMTAEPEGPIRVVGGGVTPAGAPPTGFILEDSASPPSESSTRWVLASRTSTCSTSTANGVAPVSTSSYAMWRRPSVPRTALGRVSTDAASPVSCGSGSVPATPALGSAAVLACTEVDIPATAISTATTTASRHVRRSDTRVTDALFVCHRCPCLSRSPGRRAADPTGRQCPWVG